MNSPTLVPLSPATQDWGSVPKLPRGLTIRCLGRIEYLSPAFHTSDVILPIGYHVRLESAFMCVCLFAGFFVRFGCLPWMSLTPGLSISMFDLLLTQSAPE
jgi:F/Y-rich N-terminus